MTSSRFTLVILILIAVATACFMCTTAHLDDSANDVLIRQVVPHGSHANGGDPYRLFESFKKRFGKSYSTQEEHDYRFGIFKANMNRAKWNQKSDPSAVHGVTQFSDLTLQEFRSRFFSMRLGGLPRTRAPILSTNDLPNEFDWRDHGAVRPVKDQSCGSSWSCSTTGALEGAKFLVSGNLSDLQQSVGCKPQLANFSAVSLSEHQIAANLFYKGPLAVAVNQVLAQTYVKGISCPEICPFAKRSRFDQGGLLVGYGYAPIQMKEKLYWIIKSSWGQSWGENGYYRVCQGTNICGRNSMLSLVAAAPTLHAQH